MISLKRAKLSYMALGTILLTRVAPTLLGVLLIITGIQKALEFSTFTFNIQEYGIVPEDSSPVVARVIVASEIVFGFLVLFEKSRSSGALLIALLLTCFLVAQVIAVYKLLDIPCGCQILPSEKVGLVTLIRTGLLILVALLVSRANDKPCSTANTQAGK